MNEHHGQGMGGHQRSWRGRESIIPDHAAAFEHLEFERVRQSEFETPNVGCNSHACRTMVPCPECLQDGVVGKVLLLQPGNNYYKIKLLNVITVPGLLAELTHHSADRSANVRWKPWQRPLYTIGIHRSKRHIRFIKCRQAVSIESAATNRGGKNCDPGLEPAFANIRPASSRPVSAMTSSSLR